MLEGSCGSGIWSSLGRCLTLCMPCSVPHLVIGSHTPSIHLPTATPTTLATSSLSDASWPKLYMTTASWSATLLGPSTNTSWASLSGEDVAQTWDCLQSWKSGPFSCVPSLGCLSSTPTHGPNFVYLDIQTWRAKITTSTRAWFICWKMMSPH